MAKYFGVKAGKIVISRVRFSQSDGISKVDKAMGGRGFTRRVPKRLRRPHTHPHQQPGYKQPSEQKRRRARQLLRGDRTT